MIHIANWEQEALNVIAVVDAGQPEQWPAVTGAQRDAWNEAHIAPYRSLSTADIRDSSSRRMSR